MVRERDPLGMEGERSLDDAHVRTLLIVALSHFEHSREPEPSEGGPGAKDGHD